MNIQERVNACIQDPWNNPLTPNDWDYMTPEQRRSVEHIYPVSDYGKEGR